MNRPALRAALVASGLTASSLMASACGASATPEPTTPHETTNVGVTENANVATREHCDGTLEAVSEACCNQTAGRVWSEPDQRCLYVAVPGPFVPPAVA